MDVEAAKSKVDSQGKQYGSFNFSRDILKRVHVSFRANIWMRLFVPVALLLMCLTLSLAFKEFYQNTNMHFYSDSKLSNTLPRSVKWFDPERYERPQSRLMEDFRTDCIPEPAQYYSPRVRRTTSLLDPLSNVSLPNSQDILDGWTHWTKQNTPEEFGSYEPTMGNVTIVMNAQRTYSGQDIGQPIRIDTTREETPEQDYDENPDDKKNIEINNYNPRSDDQVVWNNVGESEDPEEEEEEEQLTHGEDRPLSEEIEPDGEPATQHAFWKGQGDPYTIRKSQGRLMKQYMDQTVDPCHDFYQYACGNWAKYNPIPQDKAAFDTFEVLRESLDAIIKELLEQNLPDDPDAYQKCKDLYTSCINYGILEERGAKPLMELLSSLGGWPIIDDKWNESQFDWLWLMAQLRLYNNDVLISEWVGPDIKNSDEYVIQFDQPSLGLPTKEYYLHPSNMIYLDAYKVYMKTVVVLLGTEHKKANKEVEQVISFETELAKITSGPDERRNVSELYQRMTVGELRAYIPQIDWQRYLSIVLDRPCNISENVVIFALRYVEDLIPLLAKTPPRVICNYLLWRFVRHRVNNLDDRFQEAKQKFYYALFGREKSPPRWKNCVTQVNSNMGMAVGAMFVKKYFDEKSKNDTLIMTKEIQQSFQEILSMINWIDPVTKKLASDKINAMLLRIGYPDYILNDEKLNERYKNVVIHPDRYFENTMSILRHLTRVEHNHLGSPVNKTGWNTAPAVVNAYYSRNKNQIMFPAGILQPPFYHRHFPKSLNYGGIGVVIGHEITHGFDDKGRLFDKNGNLHRWWSDESINNFHARAQCIIEQYNKYRMEEVGHNIDGVNTQGENIADNGGVKQAFRAYKKWLKKHDSSGEMLPGLNATGLQLFFLNFAQVWCGETRPEALRNKLKTAVHAPGKFRVIGTLSNSEDFSNVFNCPLGAPMNPVKKCTVW